MRERARPIDCTPGQAARRPLPALIPAAKTTLAFHAPHGYVFTVEQAAGTPARRRRAAALPRGRPLGHRPGAGARAAARAAGDRRAGGRDGRHRPPDAHPAGRRYGPEPLLPVQYMFDSVGTAGLEPPPGGDKDGVLVIDSGLDITHPDFAGRPGVLLENPQKVRPNVDGEWHGTAVSSTIAAARNNIGMSGLYPTVGSACGRRRRRHPDVRDPARPAPRRPAPLPGGQHVVRRRGLHAARAAGVLPRLRERPDHRRRRRQRERPGRTPTSTRPSSRTS